MEKLDFNSLTLNEVEQIEAITGRSIEEIMNDGAPRGKAFKAIIWIMKRRNDKNFTLDQAGEVSMAEAAEMFAGDDEKKD